MDKTCFGDKPSGLSQYIFSFLQEVPKQSNEALTDGIKLVKMQKHTVRWHTMYKQQFWGCTGFDGGHAAGEAIPMRWVKWQN